MLRAFSRAMRIQTCKGKGIRPTFLSVCFLVTFLPKLYANITYNHVNSMYEQQFKLIISTSFDTIPFFFFYLTELFAILKVNESEDFNQQDNIRNSTITTTTECTQSHPGPQSQSNPCHPSCYEHHLRQGAILARNVVQLPKKSAMNQPEPEYG